MSNDEKLNGPISPPIFFSPIHRPHMWREFLVDVYFGKEPELCIPQDEIERTSADIEEQMKNVTWVDDEERES